MEHLAKEKVKETYCHGKIKGPVAVVGNVSPWGNAAEWWVVSHHKCAKYLEVN